MIHKCQSLFASKYQDLYSKLPLIKVPLSEPFFIFYTIRKIKNLSLLLINFIINQYFFNLSLLSN